MSELTQEEVKEVLDDDDGCATWENFKEFCRPALWNIMNNIVIPKNHNMASKDALSKVKGLDEFRYYYCINYFDVMNSGLSAYATESEVAIYRNYMNDITTRGEILMLVFPKSVAYWSEGEIVPAGYILVSAKKVHNHYEHRILFSHIDPEFQRKGE